MMNDKAWIDDLVECAKQFERLGFDAERSMVCHAIKIAAPLQTQLSQYKRERDEARRLLEVSACPSNCDDGAIPHGPDPDGNWEAVQCQLCYEREQALKATDNDS